MRFDDLEIIQLVNSPETTKMKFLFVFAVLLVAAHAQIFRDFDTVVSGPKTIVAGPSGTIHSDAGTIVKTGAARAFLAEPLLAHAPLVAPLARTVISNPLISSRTILSSPLVHHGLGFHDLLY